MGYASKFFGAMSEARAAGRTVAPGDQELRMAAEHLKSLPVKNAAEAAYRDRLVQRLSAVIGDNELAAASAGVSTAPADALKNSISNVMQLGRSKGAWMDRGLGEEAYMGQLEQSRNALRETMGFIPSPPGPLTPSNQAMGFASGGRGFGEEAERKFSGDLQRHRVAKQAIDRRLSQIGDEMVFIEEQLRSGRLTEPDALAQRAALTEEANKLSKQRVEMKRRQAQTGYSDPDDFEGTDVSGVRWGDEEMKPMRDYRAPQGPNLAETMWRTGETMAGPVSRDPLAVAKWVAREGAIAEKRARDERGHVKTPVETALELMQYLPENLPFTALEKYEEKYGKPPIIEGEGIHRRIRFSKPRPRKRTLKKEAVSG